MFDNHFFSASVITACNLRFGSIQITAIENSYFPDFVAIDLETTGLDPSHSDIIEVGATKFSGGVEVGHFKSLIRPTRSLPDRISALTGLTAGELDWAKNFSEVVPDFIKFIDNLPIVAHNAEFDMGFLKEKLPRVKHEIPTNAIWDNLKLGVLLFPELDSYALDSLAEIFGIPVEKSHRASEDCIVTGRLFNEFLKKAPAIFDRDLLKKIVYEYLEGNDLADPLKHILEHPDYDKYMHSGKDLNTVQRAKINTEDNLKGINLDSSADFLIRVNPDQENFPEEILQSRHLYPDKIHHYFTFPSTQFPGDYWGVGKKWNQLFDKVDGIELYPGKNRLLCRRQMHIFVEEDIHDRLSLTGYEIAVLSSFASSSKMGNFSRLSWWIWNNLTNLSVAIPLLNASNCEPDGCAFLKDCFYLKAVETVKSCRKVGFPFRVLKEEQNIPGSNSTREPSDLTFLNPEGIFRDNLGAGIMAFGLNHSRVLLKKIIQYLPESQRATPLKMLERTENSIEIINTLVDGIISRTGNRRLQKGKRFFLFIQDNLIEE
ncbi:MAG: 3'-5' exonuclease, partial [bacterium]